MVKNKKTAFGFGFIAASFLFLFNPSFVIVDPLPDFIGYFLLSHGVMIFADLNESVGEAVSLFRKMAMIDIGRLLAILWVFSIASSQEQASYMLLAMFVFCFLELLLMIPAYKKLFGGLSQLGDFHPNTSIHGKAEKGRTKEKRSHTDRALRTTIVFLLLKNVLAFLPELTELTSKTYEEYRSSSAVDLYPYIGLLRGVAFLPIFIIGIVWLVKVERYFYRIFKDKPFLDSVQQSYAERILPKVGLFACRTLKTAFLILLIGIVALVDFYLDSVNILPDFFAAILFFFYFLFVQKTVTVKKVALWTGVSLFFITSLLAEVADYIFHTYYFYSSHLKGEELVAFGVKAGLQILSLGMFLWIMIHVIKTLYEVIQTHTGIAIGLDPTSTVHQNLAAEQQKELRQTLIPVMVGLVFYLIATVTVILRPILSSYFEHSLGFLSLIQVGSVLFLLWAAFRAKEAIYDSVQAKYLLE